MINDYSRHLPALHLGTIYTYIHTYIHIYIHTYVCMCVCIYVCMSVYVCVCMHIYIHIYVCIHICVHTHTHTYIFAILEPLDSSRCQLSGKYVRRSSINTLEVDTETPMKIGIGRKMQQKHLM